MSPAWLYPRLSGFYLFYFAALGVMLPYWSLYLQSLGLAPARIGELIAITLITKVVAPYLWGWLADRMGRRMVIVRWACLATAVFFAGVFFAADSFVRLAVVMLLFSFFWNAALPQFEATTLNHLGAHVHRYSNVRLWGSIGFIIAALLAGVLVQRRGVDIVPALLLGLFIALWLNSLAAPEATAAHSLAEHPPLTQVLRQPPVLALLLVCFLNQASHGPYYAFFSIYLEELGYDSDLIGGLWSLGVGSEIVIFLLMQRLLPRIGPRRLMLTTVALTSLRWLLIGLAADRLPVLLLAQVLHAFSFGMYHAVSVYLFHRFFTGPHQGRGQALYNSVSFGAGGAVGSFAAGYLWAGLGGANTFIMAAGAASLGLLAAWRGLRV